MSLEDFYAAHGEESNIPLGRVGTAEEFADLATYLLSPRASYVTGVGDQPRRRTLSRYLSPRLRARQTTDESANGRRDFARAGVGRERAPARPWRCAASAAAPKGSWPRAMVAAMSPAKISPVPAVASDVVPEVTMRSAPFGMGDEVRGPFKRRRTLFRARGDERRRIDRRPPGVRSGVRTLQRGGSAPTNRRAARTHQ